MVIRLLDRWVRSGSGGHAVAALEVAQLGIGVRAAENETPAIFRGRYRAKPASGRQLAVRGVPGNPRNVGSADADVGKLAVAQPRKFIQALVVALPLSEEADKCGKHGVLLSHMTWHRAGQSFRRENRVIPVIEKQ